MCSSVLEPCVVLMTHDYSNTMSQHNAHTRRIRRWPDNGRRLEEMLTQQNAVKVEYAVTDPLWLYADRRFTTPHP